MASLASSARNFLESYSEMERVKEEPREEPRDVRPERVRHRHRNSRSQSRGRRGSPVRRRASRSGQRQEDDWWSRGSSPRAARRSYSPPRAPRRSPSPAYNVSTPGRSQGTRQIKAEPAGRPEPMERRGVAGVYGIPTVNATGAVRLESEPDSSGQVRPHEVHLVEARHWKWNNEQSTLYRAPSHPMSTMPTVHFLWEYKSGKNPAYARGYHIAETLTTHPSMKYAEQLEGYKDERPPSDRPAQSDAQAQIKRELPRPRQVPRAQTSAVKREPQDSDVKQEKTYNV